MSNDLPCIQDEEHYWRASKEFVRVLIAELNHSLKEQRITKAKRRQICHSYVFSVASLFDQQWLKVDGRTRYPLLCFTDVFLDIGVPLSQVSPVSIPHKAVELHGMVADEIDWFFDEKNQNEGAVLIGAVGEEVDDVAIDETEVEDTDTDTILPQPCLVCKGTGECYCIRKGGGDPTGCSRCQGNGQCIRCAGSGLSKWSRDRSN